MNLSNLYVPKQNYKVMVKTITYNQSKYIIETLKGVAMQNTSFPFVNIILEDNSADGEQEVIKSWLNSECNMDEAEFYDIPTASIIIATHNTNKHCTFAVYFHKENLFKQRTKRETQIDPWRMKCEYEAFCEGDDYWIDPFKLQKQVDFLENNPNYSCCHTAFNCVDHDSKLIYREDYERKIRMGANGERFWYTMLVENYILTCTFMMRTNCSITIPGHYHDYGIFLHAARQGYVGFLPDRTSCYRQTPGSIMNDPKKSAALFNAFKKITVEEILKVLRNTPGTIKEVSEFPKKKQAISRLLIFCVNTKDLNLIKDISLIYMSNPWYFIQGIFLKLLRKQPSDFIGTH